MDVVLLDGNEDFAGQLRQWTGDQTMIFCMRDEQQEPAPTESVDGQFSRRFSCPSCCWRWNGYKFTNAPKMIRAAFYRACAFFALRITT